MGRCSFCGQEMSTAEGCTLTHITLGGMQYKRIPHFRDTEPCYDCRTRFGKLHHLGCDEEICPRCGGQLIACGCR